MTTPPPRALILDFDGLMLDTETAVFEAWREFYEKEGQHLTVSDWLGAVGYVNGFDPRAHLEKLTGREFHWPDHDSQLTRRVLELIQPLPPFPGVRALLENGARLGYRLGVASNSSADWVVPGLERLGLHGYFSAVRTRETVAHHKPAPDVYLAALADLGVALPPVGSVAFEDSEPGVRAAKAAGLYVVAVPNDLTRHQDLSLADEILETLEGYEVPVFPK